MYCFRFRYFSLSIMLSKHLIRFLNLIFDKKKLSTVLHHHSFLSNWILMTGEFKNSQSIISKVSWRRQIDNDAKTHISSYDTFSRCDFNSMWTNCLLKTLKLLRLSVFCSYLLASFICYHFRSFLLNISFPFCGEHW